MSKVLVAVSALFGVWCLIAQAQTTKVYRVASLGPSTKEGQQLRQVFRAAMTNLGYVEGRNVIYVSRDAGPDQPGLAKAVDELIALKPDVLLGWESEAKVMREKTDSIPIVLTGGLDPVGSGLARSLGRPGMNVTGVVQLNDQLPQKHIELLVEILPSIERFALLFDTGAGGCRRVEKSAREAVARLGKTLVTYQVGSKQELEQAFAHMEKERPDALLPCPSVVLFNNRELLSREIVRLRIPWTSFVVANVLPGVLFAHSSSRPDDYRKAATYVDRILKGAKPSDLPMEQPSKFELVVNLKTAKALKIVIPRSILLRADRVVE